MDRPCIATDVPQSCCGVYLNFLERLQFLRDKRRMLEEEQTKKDTVT